MEISHVLVLVVTFFGLMIIGVPIVFCIGVSAVVTMLLSISTDPAMTTMAQRMATSLDSFALMAIPFFIIAGQLMNHGGIARRLVDCAKAFVGMFPGGLAYVNTISAMLMGAIAGSSVASVSGIGSMMIPRMTEEGYDKGFSTALNVTAATSGLLIPPSNIMIVYSLAAGGVSIAALFLAGYIPGILVGLSLMVVSAYVALKHKYPVSDRLSVKEGAMAFLRALPSLLLIIIVIGGIIAGIFTATEAAAVAVLYAFVLALVYREVGLRELPQILLSSAAMTAVVMLLIGASIGMSWMLAYENIPQSLSRAMMGLSDNPIVIMLLINLVLLIVGVFMDMTPAVLIFTPIFLPIVGELGIEPIQFGIIMILNLCIGLCTPPVGSILFLGCSIAKMPMTRLIKPLIPQYAAMTVVLLLVTYIPQLSLWLPTALGYMK